MSEGYFRELNRPIPDIPITTRHQNNDAGQELFKNGDTSLTEGQVLGLYTKSSDWRRVSMMFGRWNVFADHWANLISQFDNKDIIWAVDPTLTTEELKKLHNEKLWRYKAPILQLGHEPDDGVFAGLQLEFGILPQLPTESLAERLKHFIFSEGTSSVLTQYVLIEGTLPQDIRELMPPKMLDYTNMQMVLVGNEDKYQLVFPYEKENK